MQAAPDGTSQRWHIDKTYKKYTCNFKLYQFMLAYKEKPKHCSENVTYCLSYMVLDCIRLPLHFANSVIVVVVHWVAPHQIFDSACLV